VLTLKLGRTPPAAGGAEHLYIFKGRSFGTRAQEQTSTAHIPSADKSSREE
jgi:hypothetical protein